MGKRVAVIDCGTNTFNLLVLEIESKTDWKIIFKTKLAVKIGVGGFSENKIMPERLARALDALASYHATAQSLAVDEVRIFATSAVRESKNGSELVDKVRQLFNWEINVISGDREAELIFEGVNQAVEERFSDYLIMDIGGGSTEFVIVKNNKAIWRKSYLMGVSRIFEWLKPSSRITNDEVLRLKNYCHKEWSELTDLIQNHNIEILVGSSGSFDTLFDLYQFNHKQTSQKARLHKIPFDHFPSIHQWLMASTLEERLNHPVIPSLRAEYMQISSYLVKYILTSGKFKELYCSEYALKEGVLAEILKDHD